MKRPITAQARHGSVARAITDGLIVLATVDVAAPPERVFRALTTDEVERWWGAPAIYTIESWKADVREGGTWSLIIRLPDGTALPAHGEFLRVSPLEIVQTRRYDFDHPTLGRRPTRVTTTLTPIESGTRVTVRHEDFGSSEAAHEHAGGWERFLDWLAAHAMTDRPSDKVVLGKHTAVIAAHADRERIRRFYLDVLGCSARVMTDEVDRFQLEDVHFCFVYQSTALDESAFTRAIYLELAADAPDEMRRKIVASGVKTLDLPDPHLYFQAPGGQVFKLVGTNEDLSLYESSTSSKPGSSAHAASGAAR